MYLLLLLLLKPLKRAFSTILCTSLQYSLCVLITASHTEIAPWLTECTDLPHLALYATTRSQIPLNCAGPTTLRSSAQGKSFLNLLWDFSELWSFAVNRADQRERAYCSMNKLKTERNAPVSQHSIKEMCCIVAYTIFLWF
jgi:hypothetical protein